MAVMADKRQCHNAAAKTLMPRNRNSVFSALDATRDSSDETRFHVDFPKFASTMDVLVEVSPPARLPSWLRRCRGVVPFRMEMRLIYLWLAWFFRQERHVARAWTHPLTSSSGHGSGAAGRRHPPRPAPRLCPSRAPPRGVQASRIHKRVISWAEGTRGGQSWAFVNASAEVEDLLAANGDPNDVQSSVRGERAATTRNGRAAEHVKSPTDPESTPLLLQRRRRITHSPDQVAKTTLGDIMSLGLITGTGPSTSSSSASSARGGDVSDSSPAETLAARYGIHHPLDRMALTANGNLQRLICSYYDSPVTVTLDRQYRQQQVQQNEPDRDSYRSEESWNGFSAPAAPETASMSSCHVWHRVVHLSMFEQTFCTATSVITVHDPTCQALVESGRVGLGQLFRYLDLLPEFTLLGAGALDGHERDLATRTREAERPGAEARETGGGNFWREYRLDCNELSCSIREEFCPGLWDLRPRP